MPRKICVAFGCEELAEAGLSHCQTHEAIRQEKIAARKAAAQQSEEAQANRRLYRSAAWQRAAKGFLAKHPLCAHCAELGLVVPAREVDHVEPHRGDRAKFWDRSNWQPLCKPCHSRKTAGEVFHRTPRG
ncbi:5-methylcytosine-specific restriction enzyme A [Pseudooceanicola antarcticus]|uniref:Putative HNH nuclease YajD n=1 Tax=Pseudooceanicola antarcticus TaxID=1247613 RepID=A0A285J5A3_9RHOB|nr:HNH endonuclease signature motif containing protein [Pseudooceanicola antarcticus]PJE26823.1 HNH endonuclease [Pseudooceanicola antarcticus]SNY55388.1 5-methylcytosine-specific restriction enzyme A [Pseudooceanicola antarcticus]